MLQVVMSGLRWVIDLQYHIRAVAAMHFYRCLRSGHYLVVLKRNSPVGFFGVFDVQPGAYAEERFIKVAAPYALGPPIQFISFLDNYVGSSFSLHRIKWRLKALTPDVDSILEGFEDGDSIVVLRLDVSKMCAFMRQFYGQLFFVPRDSEECCAVGPHCSVLQFRYPMLYEGETAENIMKLLKTIEAKSNEGKRSITMIVGNKGTGKSMLTRVIANSLLKNFRPSVYILDCDIGQAEMNPPGCVSLLKVNSPLLGVPMFQQRTILADTYFYGRIVFKDDMTSYLMLLRRLLERFKSVSDPSSPLLINTCGWVEGKGSRLLDDLLKLFDPDFLFTLLTPTGPNYQVTKLNYLISNLLVSSQQKKRFYTIDLFVFCLTTSSIGWRAEHRG
ncbi:unnamed protein product [Gongylonema pulchrum]|uniref:AAA domain-containing protein n=1 Tax=Gongylonema pulchrum TaxID=637853 RepID=A0A183E3I7_9BILA|nr:unnamed protein product [Gongylonema pulchrum]